jgi:hypothetical protein
MPSRIRVAQIPTEAEAEAVGRLLAPFHPKAIFFPADLITGRRRVETAIVEFSDDAAASEAAHALQGSALNGQQLTFTVQREYQPTPLPLTSMPPWRHDELWEPFSTWSASDVDAGSRTELIVTPTFLEINSQVNERFIALLAENPSLLKSQEIDSRLFEEIVAELWAGFGYDVELTKRTRDGGRDVVAVRSHLLNERYLIECKHPRVGKPIEIRAVREIYGTLKHEQATKGVLATTTRFSRDAIEFIEAHKWELDGKDFDGLCSWLNLYVKARLSRNH